MSRKRVAELFARFGLGFGGDHRDFGSLALVLRELPGIRSRFMNPVYVACIPSPNLQRRFRQKSQNRPPKSARSSNKTLKLAVGIWTAIRDRGRMTEAS
jgi:hypothetical protein